ncbi:DNA-binding response regulator, OmpR family, contains REC and winged-helix (wHTH) domain [Selenomonas ruminantium]|uniref:DNA-binding response regulator, OmpR family, contains REC and winged-helix (WHTH) domain n=1 Tax=Selenomonas ruminantium TaxID=971 RepID=A0A1M6SVD2_SELRU|nr:response regulator transcription factor [Selenomonas ruminantium]SHK48607.1 DNA-binding response regulator, OmpR family, contains REC and winged-helix (wHTH) domain [Selenomonas ruminantium]
MARILIADDNEAIRDILSIAATAAGHENIQAADGEDAWQKFTAGNIDLILLDVMLPKMDGFALCRKIRQESAVPIIMITACGDDYDRIMGLDLGADDYVVKPFSTAEVMARVKAVLRRWQRDGQAAGLSCGNLHLQEERGLVEIAGAPLSLTHKEYDLLHLFLTHPQQIFSREHLLDLLWGYDYSGDTRTVDTHIRRLRAKLEKAGLAGGSIGTVWGRGYRWENEATAK